MNGKNGSADDASSGADSVTSIAALTDDDGPSQSDPSADSPARGDAQLLAAAHAGDRGAYGELWARHASAARAFASAIGRPADVDELVSEAFTRILAAIAAGKGPTESFRPYLLSTIRHVSQDLGRRYYQRVTLTDESEDFRLPATPSAQDDAEERADNSAALRAWSTLPEASRTVLWHLVVEQESLATIAPILATSPNGVSSRATRAKERLRQAFLQEHVRRPDDPGCDGPRDKLGAYVRHALSQRDTLQVQEHLIDCRACSAALDDVSDINQMLTRSVAPALVGGPVVLAAYLAAKHLPAAGAVTDGSASGSSTPGQHGGGITRRVVGAGRTKVLIGVAVVAGAAAVTVAVLASGGSTHKPGSDAQSPGASTAASSRPPGQAVAAPLVRTVQVQIGPSGGDGSVLFQVPAGWAITKLASSPTLHCVPSATTGNCTLADAAPGTYTFMVTIDPPASAPESTMTVTYQAGQVKLVQHDPI